MSFSKKAEQAKSDVRWPVLVIVCAVVVIAGFLWSRERQRQETVRRNALARQRAEESASAERRRLEETRLADERRRRDERAERQRKEDLVAMSAASGIRKEAKIWRDKVSRISDDDGFRAKKAAVDDVFSMAESFFGKGNLWRDAAAGFSNHVERCKALVKLDEERRAAVERRKVAHSASVAAEAAGAKKYAQSVAKWNATVKTWAAAEAEFGRMEFAAAADTFALAESGFVVCANEAGECRRAAEHEEAARKDEAARKAREDAARRMAESYVERPSNMNFCRHCGASVTGRLVRRACLKCGRNLFGD